MSVRPILAPDPQVSLRPTSEAVAALVELLRGRLGDRVTTSVSDRHTHGHDESWHPGHPPDAVCYALSTDEVSFILSAARDARVPVIPYGAGSSLEGHVAALHGGISVDLSRMDKIVKVRAEDLDVTVQAGVTRQQLNIALRDTGLFFPVDPGAEATLGGMAATRASGTNAVRYGTMRENVISLTVVLSDGRVVRTASRARKSSSGYDLTRLFIGSEGTLGIITEVTLRLYGIPEAVSAAVCSFPDTEAAIRTAIETIQCGVPVARMEFLDDVAMRAVRDFTGMTHACTPTLFFEFHGSDGGVAEQAETVQALAVGNGGSGWHWAKDADERAALWRARHEFHYAMLAQRPGARIWGTDACVPISALAECIGETRQDTQGVSFPAAALGHVGDGNFHMSFLIDPEDPAELAQARELNERLIQRTLRLGGTCSGEHGIGMGKSKYLPAEHGVTAVDLMRGLKALLDPEGILNPGKVLPPL
ncbi:FAD-binding protein [Paracoccus caeni]|uniref:D-lactate dehydrogenase (cytochrome) n=1 Tax=Paracoccus caeni TaxID=657651 RepID=A0A934W2M6_9RHOB|nr:FAD-linked oxidase C-terminal domain-containing protein [Paracoccus caeni]MBK4217934.1 FAD-binding protein [Paracoccus caeni]